MNRTDNLVSGLVSKVGNLHGRQFKNGGAATDPNDFVTLSQLQKATSILTTVKSVQSSPNLTGSAARVFSLSKAGTLAIQSNCCPHLFILTNQKATIVRADLQTAPTAASFICKVYQNSTLWATLTITATNSTVSLSAGTVAGLLQLTKGNFLRLDITQVGSTIPGSDLTVTIQ
jgi:hypothetical protein